MALTWRMRSLASMLAMPVIAHAAQSQSASIDPGHRSLERSVGFSWHSPAAASLGSIGHRRVYLTSLRSQRVVATAGRFAVAYVMDVVPLAIVERTGANTEKCKRNPNWVTFTCEYDTSARIAVGAGGSPLGFKLYLNRPAQARLYATGAAGALIFSSAVPVHGSARANFTFEYGLGLDVAGVTVGYKFHHISNGGTRRLNPGLDSNVLYFGFVSRGQAQ